MYRPAAAQPTTNNLRVLPGPRTLIKVGVVLFDGIMDTYILLHGIEIVKSLIVYIQLGIINLHRWLSQ